MILTWEKHDLIFKKPAQTSRGAYTQKTSWLLILSDGIKHGKGEASPLPDLSIDGKKDLEPVLEDAALWLREGLPMGLVLDKFKAYPSLLFGLECAYLDLQNGGKHILFQTPFAQGKQGIQINGLVWMDEPAEMEKQARDKIALGFSCIKFKVGAQDHDSECRMLENLRKEFSAFKLEIRLDANGAFSASDAEDLLKDFARFEIHSIEQPIKAGQWDLMGEICAKSPIPVALDEELIGLNAADDGTLMLNTIKPQYLILKPTLLGGFSNSDAWIKLAEKHNCNWWATSALEGNVGLSHIAQWVSSKNNNLPQGLGTGDLFENNFPAETFLKADRVWMRK